MKVCFMFPQTDGLGEFCFRGSNFYAELGIFALRYRFCVIVYDKFGKLTDCWIRYVSGYTSRRNGSEAAKATLLEVLI